ncbi:hypothetical protein [Bordetella sp. LUAb4]|uniref:hypothetical protein n=1 Tax=Bordetella sp. LUAb4 TaxID=2843195 RepID=UPI001E615A55|nr:hypothetical protein [Bordetella sp. LUAb4]
MKASDFPNRSAVPFADGGAKNTIPEASQAGIAPGAASFTDGFPPLTMTPLAAGGVPPNGKDFNGILNFLSSAVRWIQAGGGYPYDSDFANAIGGYPLSAILRSADGTRLWISAADDNKSDPDAGSSPAWASLPRVCSILALPTQDVGPVVIAECGEIWIWVSTTYFTGYRSPLCGRPLDGHTTVPLPNEVDAVGGLLSKTAYAGLWGYAQENGLVKDQATWTANVGAHYFVDAGDKFQLPDLRNMFRRYTGTDADTANVRPLAGRQLDALQRIVGMVDGYNDFLSSDGAMFGGNASTNAPNLGSRATNHQLAFDSARVTRSSTETRPLNVSLLPRIHA